MAQQTAVEWLITEIDAQFTHINIRWKEEMIDKAKQMEKEQISQGYMSGLIDGMNQQPKEYYNETYGNEGV